MIGARRISSEKLREHQHIKGYARCLENKGVEWDEGRNIEQMWGQVRQPMVESAREVCGLVRGGGRTKRLYGGMM